MSCLPDMGASMTRSICTALPPLAIPTIDGAPICLTVTHLEGIVYARSVFHHSMNYRSAVVHGIARYVTDPDEKGAALEAIVEHHAPRSWTLHPTTDRRELAATAVIALSLAEASVKVRSGPPSDDADDIAAGGRWAGVVPVRSSFGTPESGPAMPEPVPDHVTDRERPTPGQRSAE